MASQHAPVWFISGCSTGFGHELAKLVLARGWRAVVTARDAEPGDVAAVLDQATGGRAVEPRHEAHQGGLAAQRRAEQDVHGTGLKVERSVGDEGLVAAFVADPVEHQAQERNALLSHGPRLSITRPPAAAPFPALVRLKGGRYVEGGRAGKRIKRRSERKYPWTAGDRSTRADPCRGRAKSL